MKNGKRILALLLAAALIMAVTACGGKTPKETAAESASETEAAPTATERAQETTKAAPETTAPETTAPETAASSEAPSTVPETTEAETAPPETKPEESIPETTNAPELLPLDYARPENWAYFAVGENKPVDVFLICPTVDTRNPANAFDLNEKLKGRFVSALDMEKGIYEETGRMYSPYYRQMSIRAYSLPEDERAQAKAVAYRDISDAFRWYLEHENNGRGLILAGYSQGAEMCLELLKEYYGGDSLDAVRLRANLITVYAIGWNLTKEMTETYPQILPASGETETGSVVCFDCEDGTLSGTVIIPEGITTLSINPLNWMTDGTPADKSLNRGAVLQAGAEPVPGLCGAYIGERGELVVPDVSPKDYPPGLEILPEGAYHLYDLMFFFTNLKENIKARANRWLTVCEMPSQP